MYDICCLRINSNANCEKYSSNCYMEFLHFNAYLVVFFFINHPQHPKIEGKKTIYHQKNQCQKNCCSISKRWKIVLNVLTENKIHKQMENLWITTKFGEMLQPKNVHQLLRNQNSGVFCGSFSSTVQWLQKSIANGGLKRANLLVRVDQSYTKWKISKCITLK